MGGLFQREASKTPADWGKIKYEHKGCNSCHNVDGTKSKGPTWKGIWGTPVKLNNGTTVLVDEAYVRESMMQPGRKWWTASRTIMPTFQGLVEGKSRIGLVLYESYEVKVVRVGE